VTEGVERRMHALLELEGGCFMGEVCKEQLAMKTSPLPGHPACTGFSWQQVSNGTHCLKAYRTGNREVRARACVCVWPFGTPRTVRV